MGDQEALCEYFGCTNPNADNYDPNANVDDDSCEVYGCMYDYALNFNPNATYDDPEALSCLFGGCLDAEATNYDPNADQDDGSCFYGSPAECVGDLNEDLTVDVQDLLIFFQVYGTFCTE